MEHAILHFVWAQVWCVILVIAVIGWGHLVLKWLLGKVASLGLAMAVGLAFAVTLGGILNLLTLITPGVLIAFTLVGFALALVQFVRLSESEDSGRSHGHARFVAHALTLAATPPVLPRVSRPFSRGGRDSL